MRTGSPPLFTVYICAMHRYLFLLFTLLIACHAPNDKNAEQKSLINTSRANRVIASDSMRITDALNELYFSVEIVSTDRSDKGVYEILASYGHHDASTQITMPAAGAPLIPELRRGNASYSYIIGFRYGSDTSFRKYYLIKAEDDKIVMKYLKAYSFQ